MNKDLGNPYQALGAKIKAARLSLKRTIAEASGAIELDEATFKQIERGEQRPAEDTLMVLISYLEIKEEDAAALWELAGYNDAKQGQGTIFDLGQPVAMMMPMDLRVVYTDMVHVMINDFGVVMNFFQGTGQPGQQGAQPLAVARIGMSKEHAKSVLDILDKSLKQSEKQYDTKMLKPAPQQTDKSDAKDK
jgi:DNA-binding XRE family transcriptional regulator